MNQDLQKLAHSIEFDNLLIENATVCINIGATQAVKFSGIISLLDFDDVEVDVAAIRSNAASIFFGASLPFSSLEVVLERFFPVNLTIFSSIFSGQSQLTLYLTNGFNFENISSFKPSYVSDSSWDSPFVGIGSSVKLSSVNNNMTSFLKRYLSDDVEFLLSVSLSPSFLNCFIGLPLIQLSPNISLERAGVSLQFQMGVLEPQLSLTATMNLMVKNIPLVFDGALTFNLAEVTLTFLSKKVWNSVFGIDRLSFGSVTLGAGVSYVGTFAEFILGAELAVGVDCFDNLNFKGNGYCLYGHGVGGLDLVNPAASFVYAEISSLTLDVILRSLLGSQKQQDVIVPSILHDAPQ